MPSVKFSVNLPLYKQALRRWWLVAVLYAGGLSLLVLDETSDWLRQGKLLYARQNLLNFGARFGALITCIFALITVMAVFSWMYNTRSTAHMTALPIRRKDIFVSQMLAGGTLLLSAQIVTALLYLLAGASAGCADSAGAGQLLLILVTEGMLYYGFALFCAMLTGSLPILPCIFAILNATAVVLETMVKYIAEFMVFGLGQESWGIEWLSPLFLQLTSYPAVIENSDTAAYAPGAAGGARELSLHFYGWKLYAVFAAVGIVLAVLAWLLFRKRRMETAGETVAIDALRPTFRWCLALAFSLVGGVVYLGLAFDSCAGHGTWPRVLVLLVCMLLSGGAGWLVSEMLIERRLRPAKRYLRGLALYSAILVFAVCLTKADAAGFEERLPAEGEITSVTVGCPFYGIGADNRSLSEITDREVIREVLALQEEILTRKGELMADRDGINALTILWETGEEQITRVYYVRSEDTSLRARWGELQNSTAITEKRLTLSPTLSMSTFSYGYVNDFVGDTFLSITAEEALDFYENAVLPDIAAGTLGRVYAVQDGEYYASVSDLTLSLGVQLNEMENLIRDSLELQIPFAAERTVAWLREHGATPGVIVPEEANISVPAAVY